jgi:hypothetical protein
VGTSQDVRQPLREDEIAEAVATFAAQRVERLQHLQRPLLQQIVEIVEQEHQARLRIAAGPRGAVEEMLAGTRFLGERGIGAAGRGRNIITTSQAVEHEIPQRLGRLRPLAAIHVGEQQPRGAVSLRRAGIAQEVNQVGLADARTPTRQTDWPLAAPTG